ncbi:hypothetical protein CEE56_14575 [Stenotrophomonas maltophilia]|nr:hypothetical protein CEE56_14575 [Stenotrophomonas maltophilia]
MAWIYPIAENCKRWGGIGGRGVSRMDAAAKPPRTGLRRPRPPIPHRQPTECMPLLLLLPWLGLKPLRVQGAALPKNPQCSRAATAARNPSWACPDSGA